MNRIIVLKLSKSLALSPLPLLKQTLKIVPLVHFQLCSEIVKIERTPIYIGYINFQKIKKYSKEMVSMLP